MSRAHEEAAELLDRLLRDRPDQQPPSLEEIDQALERIEELSKLAPSDVDETYLCSVGEAILGLRTSRLAKEK